MGLGSLELVTLAKARDKALLCRTMLLDGIDPLEERRSKRTRALLTVSRVTFRTCAERYIEAHAPGWKNSKHRQQWRNTLETYAYPVIGDLPVTDIDTGRVLEIIQPLWMTKTETASRLRGRIESILDWQRCVTIEQARIRPAGAATWTSSCHRSPRSRRPTTTKPCLIPRCWRSWPSCVTRPASQPDAWSSRS
jgi:hypothetical protein